MLGPASSHPREPVHTSLVGLRLERSIDECLRRDVAPLPTPEDRGGYHGQRHFDFWLSGLADHLRIIDAAARVGVTLAAGDRVLDFGCGSGRVLRHFLAQRPELEAWGVDANPAAVEWIASNLSPAAKVFRTTTFPHLPLPDASFKVAFALAVFSHLDELDIAQLLELRRCLVPGGIAYVSVQTDATWARLDESNPAFRLVQAARDAHPDLDLSPEALRACHLQIGIDDCSTDLDLRGAPVFRELIGPMPEGRTIVRYETPDVFEVLTREWAMPKPPRRRRRATDSATEATPQDG